ncbi:MAG: 3-phenylpropionate/trans-cinnamate dioxygenase ferredoxin reductase subunit [Halieaceae bacterium]|jgi:3-phenylpropionate/trans-cinnamate dioxygenase ferredoxin reductase subunit
MAQAKREKLYTHDNPYSTLLFIMKPKRGIVVIQHLTVWTTGASMNNKHAVIVGASHASAQLAGSLRQGGWDGNISIVGDEAIPPYHRPPLSKAYLSGEKHSDELLIRPATFYKKTDIDLVLGTRVTAIDPQKKTIALHDGGSIPYDKLALTTGARVRKLELPGHEQEGIFYLRDLNNVDQIRTFTGPGKSAVIIGGGYIGLETAASMRKLGMQVTVLEAMPRVLQRVTAPEVSAFYSRVHGEEGVKIITDAAVQALEGNGTVTGVALADGTRLEADIVVIGVGVIPNTELAESAGLEVDNGIVVDEFARTSDADIVAAGDCTNHFNPLYARRLRLESVQNATDQAKTAANTLCEKLEAYNALPWFWSDQYDLKLQIAGLSQGFDSVIMRGTADSGRSFAAFYFSGDQLLAVDAVNRPKEFMSVRRALSQGQSADPEILADDSADIRQAFTP